MSAFQVSFHTQAFIYVMYAGFVSCALFDLLRPLFYGKNLILVLIFDLFLSILTAFFVFLSIYFSGASKIRLYMCFAFVTGGIIYLYSIKRVIQKWADARLIKRKSPADVE